MIDLRLLNLPASLLWTARSEASDVPAAAPPAALLRFLDQKVVAFGSTNGSAKPFAAELHGWQRRARDSAEDQLRCDEVMDITVLIDSDNFDRETGPLDWQFLAELLNNMLIPKDYDLTLLQRLSQSRYQITPTTVDWGLPIRERYSFDVDLLQRAFSQFDQASRPCTPRRFGTLCGTTRPRSAHAGVFKTKRGSSGVVALTSWQSPEQYDHHSLESGNSPTLKSRSAVSIPTVDGTLLPRSLSRLFVS